MDRVTEKVMGMYKKYPFPSYSIETTAELEDDFVIRNIFRQALRMPTNALKGKKVLDAGCGTGEFSCAFACHGADVTAFDLNPSSLERARALAKKFDLENIEFGQLNIFDLDSKDKYDFIFSLGVLHHTPDAELGYRKLAEAVKKGGYLTVGLYNSFGRLQQRAKQLLVSAIAGKDVDRRIAVAKKLFKGKFAHEAWWADQYAHVHEKNYTIGQVLSWVRASKLELVGATPPLEINSYNSLKWFPSLGRGKLERSVLQFLWIFPGSCDHFLISARKP